MDVFERSERQHEAVAACTSANGEGRNAGVRSALWGGRVEVRSVDLHRRRHPPGRAGARGAETMKSPSALLPELAAVFSLAYERCTT